MNKFHMIKKDECLLSDRIHEGIRSEEFWKEVQVKRKSNGLSII